MSWIPRQGRILNSFRWFFVYFNYLILLIFLDLLSYIIRMIDLSFSDDFYLCFVSLFHRTYLNFIAPAFALLSERF
jgi:hypothetical protein